MKTKANTVMRFGDYHGRIVDGKVCIYSTRADALRDRYTEGVFTRDDVVTAIALMKFVGSRALGGTGGGTQVYRYGNATVQLTLTPQPAPNELDRSVPATNGSYTITRVTPSQCNVGCTEVTLQQAQRVLGLL